MNFENLKNFDFGRINFCIELPIFLKFCLIFFCIGSLNIICVNDAKGSPIAFGSNHYEFIEVSDPFDGNNNSWDTANASASASIYNGTNGHLATITSEDENDFLFSLVTGNYLGFKGAWIGGKAPEGWLVGPESGLTFVAAGYENWAGIEPNNQGYAYLSIGTTTGVAQWLDDSIVPGGTDAQGLPHPANDPVIGFFIEYEGTNPVPEPTTLLLFGIGLLGLAAVSRRKK